ncbi:MAG TPA: DMT family transporter [Burkholderiaceae bacterium]|nr:DMT family transporter [Burkholderiaceae bacterium]
MPSFWMLFACAMFALSGALVKLAYDLGASLSQTVLLRGLPSIVIILIWALWTHRRVTPPRWTPHIARNIAGGLAMWLSFYAMANLPLSMAFSLNYTGPLFIAGWTIIRGDMQRDAVRLTAVVLGFLGVIAILQPTIQQEQWFAGVVGLLSGACAAIAWMQLRQLGQAKEPEWRTVLIFSVFTSLSSLAALAVEGWTDLSASTWSALVGMGLLGMLGQLALTRAYGSGSTLLTAALHYSTIVFATFLGFALWGDRPGALAGLGIALVIASGILSSWNTLRQNRKARQAKPALTPESNTS